MVHCVYSATLKNRDTAAREASHVKNYLRFRNVG